MYLDTDVLSLTNTGTGYRAHEAEAWRDWVRANERGLFLSVVTVMEVRFGIEKCRAKGATNKADRLAKWLAAAETSFRERILPVSIDIADDAGALLYAAVASGMAPSTEDALIAATAKAKGFTVLSRNARDMLALKVAWRNPFVFLPPNIDSLP